MIKTIKHHRAAENRYMPAYPNAAAPGYFAQKLLDGITSAITGMGIIAILFFLLTM